MCSIYSMNLLKKNWFNQLICDPFYPFLGGGWESGIMAYWYVPWLKKEKKRKEIGGLGITQGRQNHYGS